ncbi:MAG: hypothetical protein K8R50_03480 [Betaproteobacteria bacterium]|nr:hypothetical protein [Betaproteobacteria bacterium]
MAWILDIDTTVTIYSDIKVAPRPVTTRLSRDASAAQFVPMGLAICDSRCNHMFRAASLSVQQTAFPSLSWNIRVQNMGQRYRVRADCENCFDELKESMGSGAYSTQDSSADLLELWRSCEKNAV